MEIKNHDLWYSYLTYFLNFDMDLNQIALNMINMDFAELIIHSNETVYWRNTQGDIKSKKIPLVMQENGLSQFNIPKDEMKPVQVEFLYQAYNMRHNENIILHSDFNEKLQFIRIFLGVCYFQNKGETIAVYPQIKIYRNGVVLLFFRRINNDSNLTIDEFVQEEVNFPFKKFERLWVYPGILLANQLTYEKGRIYNYSFINKKQKDKLEALKELFKCDTYNVSDNEEGFEFKVLLCANQDGEIFKLDDLQEMIFGMINYSANMNIKRPLQNKLKYILHSYWRGIPLIYLLEYSEQPHATSDFTEEQKGYFKSILARTKQKLQGNEQLIDYRPFEDYSVYVNEATVLWILSKSGLSTNQEFSDLNRGHLVNDKQIQSEMLLYILALHHKIFTISTFDSASSEEIIRKKIYIAKVYRDFEKASSFGEINDLLKAASKMGIDKLKKNTDLNLDLKKELEHEIKTKNTNYFSWLIAILFGIVGLPTFTTGFLISLWKISSIPIPQSQDKQYVISYIVSLVTFSVALWYSYYRTNKKR